jgi:phage FluMu protein Com
MNVSATPAEARFDNVAFSTEVDDGFALPIYAKYTCPRCSEQIAFQKVHFESRAWRKLSNLSAAAQTIFDEWARNNGYAGKAFLDWQCPRCSLAARVYIQHWAGGRGDGGANLKVVLESDA